MYIYNLGKTYYRKSGPQSINYYYEIGIFTKWTKQSEQTRNNKLKDLMHLY